MTKKPTNNSPRPYFLPADVDFDSLPEALRIALETVVQPVYDELVLGAPNALERAVGASFVFLLTEEVIEQMALGQTTDLDRTRETAETHERQKAMAHYLKLLGAKNATLHSLQQLRKLTPLKRYPSTDTLRP